MEEDSLFHHSLETPSLDEQRRLATLRAYRLKKWDLINLEVIVADMRKVLGL